MNDAKGWDVLANLWGRISEEVRNYDVIDGEVLSVHDHDMSVRELD